MLLTECHHHQRRFTLDVFLFLVLACDDEALSGRRQHLSVRSREACDAVIREERCSHLHGRDRVRTRALWMEPLCCGVLWLNGPNKRARDESQDSTVSTPWRHVKIPSSLIVLSNNLCGIRLKLLLFCTRSHHLHNRSWELINDKYWLKYRSREHFLFTQTWIFGAKTHSC